MTWGYDSTVAQAVEFSGQNSLFGHADNLLTDLANKRRGEDEQSRPIVFVGHSMGGLVIKQALIRSSAMHQNRQDGPRGAISSCTRGVMFLGTPHRGSDKESLAGVVARLAHLAYRMPNRQLLETLARDSHILESQRSAFDSISRDISIVCFYEEIPTAIGMIVPESSACIDGFKVRKASIPANHMDMARFDDPNAVGYQRVLSGVLDILSDARDETMPDPHNDSGYLLAPTEKLQREILESLKFDELDDRHYGIAPEHAETFEWLLTDSQTGFPDWLRNGQGIYWISGKAGSGKSTLMKYAISKALTRQLLDEEAGDDPPFLAHFFFHGRGSDMQRSFQGLLQSIIYKVLSRHPKLVPRVLPAQPYKQWPEAALNTSFQKLLTEDLGCRLNIILFIDGLDEFSGHHGNIAEFLSTVCERSIHPFRICIASRPLPVFEHRFQQYPRLQLQDKTGSDIALFVREELYSTQGMGVIRDQDPWGAQRLTDAVVSKSCGVFLWVRLATRSLVEGLIEGENLAELWVRLGKLPTELDDLFQVMLGHIKPEHLEEAARMFQLVRWAPTSFHLPLFAFALDTPEANLAQPIRDITHGELLNLCNRAVLRLQSRCAGLIEVVKINYSPFGDDRQVQFLHQSVKDFMELPNNWTALSAQNQPDFRPARSILGAMLRASKCSWKYRDVDSQWMDTFGKAASLAERIHGQPQTDMLEEFDRVMTLEHKGMVDKRRAEMQEEGIVAPYCWVDYFLEMRGYPSVPANLLTFIVWSNLTVSVAQSDAFKSLSQADKDALLNLKARQAVYPYRVRDCLPMMRYLVQSGADPNAAILLHSAWHVLLKSAFYQYEPRHLDVVELFLTTGVDLNAMINFDYELTSSAGNRRHELEHCRADYSPLAILMRLPDSAKSPQLEHVITGLPRIGAVERVVLSPFLGYPPCDPRLPTGIYRSIVLAKYGGRELSPQDLCNVRHRRARDESPPTATRSSPSASSTDTFKMVVEKELAPSYLIPSPPSDAYQAYNTNIQYPYAPAPYASWAPAYSHFDHDLPLRPAPAQPDQNATAAGKGKGKGRWRNIFR